MNDIFAKAKLVVVKVGSALLVDPSKGELRRDWLASLCDDVAALKKQGMAVVLGLAESTVSHHLTQLRNAGLVISQRRGMNVFHQVRRDALQALCTALDPDCCT